MCAASWHNLFKLNFRWMDCVFIKTLLQRPFQQELEFRGALGTKSTIINYGKEKGVRCQQAQPVKVKWQKLAGVHVSLFPLCPLMDRSNQGKQRETRRKSLRLAGFEPSCNTKDNENFSQKICLGGNRTQHEQLQTRSP